MAATISLTFGTLALDDTNNITIGRISEKAGKPVRVTNIPKTQGGIAETALIKEKEITIEGDIAGTDYDDLRTNLDSLHAGLLGQGLAKLTKDNERYIMCQLRDFSYSYDHMTRRATWTARFTAHYPFWLAETATQDDRNPTSGVGYVLTNSGNAPTRLKITIIPTSTMADACKIENQTTGESFQYRGSVAIADMLEIDNRYDTDDFEVINDGTDDFVNYEGDFLTLNSGNNTIIFTGTTNTNVIMDYRNCWY